MRRADDLTFRYTHDAGRRDAGWEERRASIIVTRQSVIIHKNEKLGLEITPRTRRFVQVRRDGDRVRISAGGGGVGGELVVRAAGRRGGLGGRYPGGDQGSAGDDGALMKSSRGGSYEPPFESSDWFVAAQGFTLVWRPEDVAVDPTQADQRDRGERQAQATRSWWE